MKLNITKKTGKKINKDHKSFFINYFGGFLGENFENAYVEYDHENNCETLFIGDEPVFTNKYIYSVCFSGGKVLFSTTDFKTESTDIYYLDEKKEPIYLFTTTGRVKNIRSQNEHSDVAVFVYEKVQGKKAKICILAYKGDGWTKEIEIDSQYNNYNPHICFNQESYYVVASAYYDLYRIVLYELNQDFELILLLCAYSL